MKKLISILTLLMLCACTALAEAPDYSAMTDEELSAAMTALSLELGKRAQAATTVASEESLGKIKDLFPDEALAMCVRDRCSKFSIEQTVTQAELDKVIDIVLYGQDYGNFTDLTGIGYLRNLRYFCLYNTMDYEGATLPEEFYTLVNLEFVEIAGCRSFSELSDSLGNLINLERLNIERTAVSVLPESIGNLRHLKELNIGYTNITTLPDSIWSLELTSLDMSGLPIK